MKLTTKLLLVALSCAAGLLVGAFFSNSLKRKRDFFSELLYIVPARRHSRSCFKLSRQLQKQIEKRAGRIQSDT